MTRRSSLKNNALVVLKAEYASVVWMRCWFDSDRGLKWISDAKGNSGRKPLRSTNQPYGLFGFKSRLIHDGPIVQRIERRFPMPEICVRFALGLQNAPVAQRMRARDYES